MGARRAWLLAALLMVSLAPVAWAQPEEPEVEMEPDEGPAPDVPLDPPPPDVPAPPVEPDPATKAAAKKLLDGGDAFFKKGDYYVKRKKPDQAKDQYERALAAYIKARELVPNPKIFFPIATAEEKLEKWVDAATHYRLFLGQAGEIDAKLRADAEKRLENVKLNVGVLALAISPEGAQVSIEGNVVGTSPLAEPLFLAPGEYLLTITADGYKPTEQKLTIEAGSESEREFELESAAVIIDTPRPPPPPPDIPMPPKPSKLPLYGAAGLTGAFFVGATVTGIIAVGKQGTFKDDGNDEDVREDARQSGKSMALLTDGLVLGTLVAGGVTAYYYMKVYKPKNVEYKKKVDERNTQLENQLSRGPKVLVTPWVQAGAGGLMLTGSL